MGSTVTVVLNKYSVTADISAQNTFSDAVFIQGDFAFSLWGAWVGTVHIQRSYDDGATWLDVDAFTSNVELVGNEAYGAKYRFGIKTGNYTSGTVNGRIG